MVGKKKIDLIKRSVDSKGRVVLPVKGLNDVYMAVVGDIILVSPNPDLILELLKSLDEINFARKKKAIAEWFRLVEEAGLDNLSPELIDRLVSRSVVRELK